MRPIDRFLRKPKRFWASVRSLSQHIGYSKNGALLVPSLADMCEAFRKLELDQGTLAKGGVPTSLGSELLDYFETRATTLTEYVEPRLMDAAQAKATFLEYRKRLNPTCPIPMNKQKGAKRAEAFLTGCRLRSAGIDDVHAWRRAGSDPRATR